MGSNGVPRLVLGEFNFFRYLSLKENPVMRHLPDMPSPCIQSFSPWPNTALSDLIPVTFCCPKGELKGVFSHLLAALLD